MPNSTQRESHLPSSPVVLIYIHVLERIFRPGIYGLQQLFDLHSAHIDQG